MKTRRSAQILSAKICEQNQRKSAGNPSNTKTHQHENHNHLLYDDKGKQISYQPTPNKGGKYVPQYLVMHYTAVTQARGSINWFLDKKAKASAHLLIDRDGTVTQFAPFNVVCWHAGESRWNGLVGLNQYSIGIEMVNGGRLSKSGANWICPVDKKSVPEADVIHAVHKNETVATDWQDYTEIQLQVAIEIGTLLMQAYKLKDVVGHEDIAPFRKIDPGPAFPMGSFRSKISGRKDLAERFITTTTVNIRSGAGTQFAPVAAPLPKNTTVNVMKRDTTWCFVEVEGTVNGVNDVEGWVSAKFIEPKK